MQTETAIHLKKRGCVNRSRICNYRIVDRQTPPSVRDFHYSLEILFLWERQCKTNITAYKIYRIHINCNVVLAFCKVTNFNILRLLKSVKKNDMSSLVNITGIMQWKRKNIAIEKCWKKFPTDPFYFSYLPVKNTWF